MGDEVQKRSICVLAAAGKADLATGCWAVRSVPHITGRWRCRRCRGEVAGSKPFHHVQFVQYANVFGQACS